MTVRAKRSISQSPYQLKALKRTMLLPGEDRGPVLEVIVSRTNFISSHTSKTVRVVGLSTALANARDLADWLGIRQVRYPLCTSALLVTPQKMAS